MELVIHKVVQMDERNALRLRLVEPGRGDDSVRVSHSIPMVVSKANLVVHPVNELVADKVVSPLVVITGIHEIDGDTFKWHHLPMPYQDGDSRTGYPV